MIHIIGNNNSVFNEYIAEIRDEKIQKDSMRFRRNMERMGEIMAYEISKTLAFEKRETTTPLGIATINRVKEQPVIATILRAGLTLHQGILNYFDKAENAFISAYRKHHKDGSFDVQVEYLACPDINNKTLILCDPMLATGSSMVLTYKALLNRGKPSHIHIVSIIASTEGVEYAKKNLPENVTIWCGAVDDELTAQAYIVPGLGDAGDLAFGDKI
ncbi:MAG: uracil phosphoribosyltransferase [Bacteroidia bacterium]|nr:uracil phosphoribosyltransferase [Bacteroidia bacterium]